MKVYVCTNNPDHKTDKMTADGYCSKAECWGTGLLVEKEEIEVSALPEIGLAILLMDVSGSMQVPAFQGNPATRVDCVVRSASTAILGLSDITLADQAYIMPVVFDHEVRPVFVKSVAQIVQEYRDPIDPKKMDPQRLAEDLRKHFTFGGTDINQALAFAKEVYDDLVHRNTLARFGGPDRVQAKVHQVALPDRSTRTVPNVRVLIYTDGNDEVKRRIDGNPFKTESTDVLLGAYFGNDTDEGCAQLKAILSKCPIHDSSDQFFILNSPDRIAKLRYLFRMASSTSGFCATCLDRVQRDASTPVLPAPPAA